MAIPEATQEDPAVGAEVEAFNAFVELHRYQLAELPQSLWPVSPGWQADLATRQLTAAPASSVCLRSCATTGWTQARCSVWRS